MSSYMHFRNGRKTGTSYSFFTIGLALALPAAFVINAFGAHLWMLIVAVIAVWLARTVSRNLTKERDAQHQEWLTSPEGQDAQLAAVMAENERLRAEANRAS